MIEVIEASEDFACLICDTHQPLFVWTDTHGVAQCSTCGTPYRILHYHPDTKLPLGQPPELLVKEPLVPYFREYWKEQRLVMPGGCSFPGGQELATPLQAEAFTMWMNQRLYRDAQNEAKSDIEKGP